jgi:DNA adenine methylase
MGKNRTPLRYPGGKQKLTPFIRELLVENGLIGGHYVEPYAGGAGVGIELLLGDYVSHIYLNDSSFPIYCFWNSIVSHPDEFCWLIRSASLDVDEWKRHRTIFQNPTQYSEIEVGFSTFYLNRCNRSGILSGGLIGGLAQTGEWKMDARFPRNELIYRIEAIAEKSDSISVKNLDAERFILEYIPSLPENTLVYCDPPYFKKSRDLYLHHYGEKDHARIAGVIQNYLARRWVVSYDSVPEILHHYAERKHFSYSLQYNALEAYKGQEIFIFSDDVRIPTNSSLSYINAGIQLSTAILHQ